MNSELEIYVNKMRELAEGPSPALEVKAYLRDTVGAIVSGDIVLPNFDEDEVMMYENDHVSIWHLRFHPNVLVPPHDHQMNAYIGVYDGAEHNHFYRQEQNTLHYVKSKVVAAGDVLSIGPDGIHTVQAHGDQPCQSLHVYLGAVSIVERSLFDWDTGEAIAYTIPAYDRLKREVS